MSCVIFWHLFAYECFLISSVYHLVTLNSRACICVGCTKTLEALFIPYPDIYASQYDLCCTHSCKIYAGSSPKIIVMTFLSYKNSFILHPVLLLSSIFVLLIISFILYQASLICSLFMPIFVVSYPVAYNLLLDFSEYCFSIHVHVVDPTFQKIILMCFTLLNILHCCINHMFIWAYSSLDHIPYLCFFHLICGISSCPTFLFYSYAFTLSVFLKI